MGEVRREIVHHLVKTTIIIKREVFERGREVVERLVKF